MSTKAERQARRREWRRTERRLRYELNAINEAWLISDRSEPGKYDQAEESAYFALEEHREELSTFDAFVNWCREMRGSFRVGARGLSRWWDGEPE